MWTVEVKGVRADEAQQALSEAFTAETSAPGEAAVRVFTLLSRLPLTLVSEHEDACGVDKCGDGPPARFDITLSGSDDDHLAVSLAVAVAT